MLKYLWTVVLAAALLLGACGGDSKDTKDDTTTAKDVTADVPSADVPVDNDIQGEDVVDDTAAEVTEDVVVPPRFCLDDQVEAKDTFTLDGMDGPVEVIIDNWGVPHIYATTERDLFIAQGFVVARYRFIQMHAMRYIASGLFADSAAATPDDLSNDVYMRTIKLRATAEKMWENVQNVDGVSDMLLNFSAGVNAYIAAVQAGTVDKPLEWPLVGDIVEWTPVDTLTIARLQSWDLSFDGRTDKVHNAARVAELLERWSEDKLVVLVEDLHQLAPATETIVLDFDQDRNPPVFDLGKSLAQGFYKRLPASYWKQVQKSISSVPLHPGALGTRDVGSNNWTVSGDLTEDGASLVANDTHLSLRNPPVFFEVHLNTTRAGGDIDAAGVCFPGIPGVILGRNQNAAWGATVYYADATDIYVESLILGDEPVAMLNGEQVPLETREEVFYYKVGEDDTCEDWINDFIAGAEYTLETTDDGKCKLTVSVLEVPHHGPVIPGSLAETESGKGTALTWKWTGFEPTDEVVMLYEYLRMASTDDFLAAVANFGVGAQNWVYGDVDGHIAYAAFANIPVRECLTDVEEIMYPGFLPYPGDGKCEWSGMVPLDQLPQAVDPARGYIFTANGDSLGYTLDGDPYNDESYQGYMFAPGLRANRIAEKLAEKVAAGKLTVADMQSIQAEHYSPLGARLTPFVLAAIQAANDAKDGVEGSDPALAAFADDARLAEVEEYLGNWSFNAAAGVLDDTSDAEAKDAIATSIFNAWLVFAGKEILGDKMESPYDIQFQVRFTLKLFEAPETLASYDAEAGDSFIWDNTTTEEVESRNVVILTALVKALDFLADPEVVGIPENGGFGTDDMTQWHWGKLHALKMRHALGGKFNIPSDDEFLYGYPRPGDNFSVDAANAGMSDTYFSYSSGAAIRNVYIMEKDNPRGETVIPGGQDASVGRPHYADQFDLWKKNETHPLHGSVDALVPDSESCFIVE